MRTIALANLLCLLATLAVNALANILPINGYNTGEVSALYPNLFVPDGFTFSIWSVIYLWLLAFCAWGFKLAGTRVPRHADVKNLKRISPWFWFSCLLNISWIIAWHFLLPGLSLLIMLALLAVLIRILLGQHPLRSRLSANANWFLVIPFTIYLAWISVATIANTTAWLVHLQWQGWGIDGAYWSVLMAAIATGLGIYMALKLQYPAFLVVVMWALGGIYRQHQASTAIVGWAALAGLALSLVMLAWQAWTSYRQR
jgi:hypothetical protein